MFESYFRNVLMLLVLGSPTLCSLSDFDRVFGDPKFRADLLENCEVEMVRDFALCPANPMPTGRPTAVEQITAP